MRVLIRNAACNWASFACQVVVAFFLTPIVLRELGETKYGLWALMIGITGYYGLLDLGFRAGLTQFIARYVAEKKYEELRSLVSTAWLLLFACCLAVLMLLPVVVWGAPNWFSIPSTDIAEFRTCLVVLGAGIIAQFALFPYSATLPALQRYDLAAVIGIGSRVLSAGATVAALKYGYGLIGISVATLLTNVVDYVARGVVAMCLLPQLRFSWKLCNRHQLRTFLSFGGWNTVATWSISLKTYSSALIIGVFLTPAAIACFELANRLAEYFAMNFSSLARVFYPAIVQLDAEGKTDELKRLYLRGSRVMLTTMVSAATVTMFCAPHFYTVWLSDENEELLDLKATTKLFSILLVTAFFAVSRIFSNQVLLGLGRVKTMSLLAFTDTIAHVLLALGFVRIWGSLGVSISLLIPAVILGLVIQPFVVNRQLRVDGFDYAREVWLPPALVLVCSVGPCLLIANVVEFPVTWIGIIQRAVVFGVVCFVFFVMLGLNAVERSQLLLRLQPFIQGKRSRSVAKPLRKV